MLIKKIISVAELSGVNVYTWLAALNLLGPNVTAWGINSDVSATDTDTDTSQILHR